MRVNHLFFVSLMHVACHIVHLQLIMLKFSAVWQHRLSEHHRLFSAFC